MPNPQNETIPCTTVRPKTCVTGQVIRLRSYATIILLNGHSIKLNCYLVEGHTSKTIGQHKLDLMGVKEKTQD